MIPRISRLQFAFLRKCSLVLAMGFFIGLTNYAEAQCPSGGGSHSIAGTRETKSANSYGSWSAWSGWDPSTHYTNESGTQTRSRTVYYTLTVYTYCSKCNGNVAFVYSGTQYNPDQVESQTVWGTKSLHTHSYSSGTTTYGSWSYGYWGGYTNAGGGQHYQSRSMSRSYSTPQTCTCGATTSPLTGTENSTDYSYSSHSWSSGSPSYGSWQTGSWSSWYNYNSSQHYRYRSNYRSYTTQDRCLDCGAWGSSSSGTEYGSDDYDYGNHSWSSGTTSYGSWSYGTPGAWSYYSDTQHSRVTPKSRSYSTPSSCSTCGTSGSSSSGTDNSSDTSYASHSWSTYVSSYGTWSYGTWSDWTPATHPTWDPATHFTNESATWTQTRTIAKARSVNRRDSCATCSGDRDATDTTETSSDTENQTATVWGLIDPHSHNWETYEASIGAWTYGAWGDWSPAWDPATHYVDEFSDQSRTRPMSRVHDLWQRCLADGHTGGDQDIADTIEDSTDTGTQRAWGTVLYTQSTPTISPTSQTIQLGQSITFTTTGGTSTGDFVWGATGSGTGTSKDVTFNSLGAATVTVYRQADSLYRDSATATANITVTKGTPAITGWTDQTRTGKGTFPTAFTTSLSNIIAGGSPIPIGVVTFTVTAANGAGAAPAVATEVNATTVFQPGVYTLRASYPGDTNYNSGVWDVTFTVNNTLPTVTATINPTTLKFGQTTRISSTAADNDGHLSFHSIMVENQAKNGYLRPNGIPDSGNSVYDTATLSSNFSSPDYVDTTAAGSTNNKAITWLPYFVGTQRIYGHAADVTGANATPSTPTITIERAMPTITGWSNKWRSGTGTFPTAFDTALSNPYTTGVTPPSGAPAYIIKTANAGAYPTSGAVNASTSFLPGVYSITATYPGDVNYEPNTWDTTFIVDDIQPQARGRANATNITFGESINFYADGTDPDGNLTELAAYVRTPSKPAPDWTGWTGINGSTFAATGDNTLSTTYTPPSAGYYDYHCKAIDAARVYDNGWTDGWTEGGLDNFAPINTWTSGSNVVVFPFTVNKATPSITGWTNQSRTGTGTFASAFGATLSNPYSTEVAQPTGTPTFAVIATTGEGAYPTSGAVNALTAFLPGTYTVQASYAGDTNYNPATWDVTFTVANQAPAIATLATGIGSRDIVDNPVITVMQSIRFDCAGSDSDGNLDRIALEYMGTPHGTFAPNSTPFAFNGTNTPRQTQMVQPAHNATISGYIQFTIPGTYTFRTIVGDAAGSWSDTSASIPVTVTVDRADAVVTFADRNFTETTTLTSEMLGVVSSPWRPGVAPTASAISYKVVNVQGEAASLMVGADVTVGTVLAPGIYTIQLAFAGDLLYKPTTKDAVYTVTGRPPTGSITLDSGATTIELGQTFVETYTATAPDNNLKRLAARRLASQTIPVVYTNNAPAVFIQTNDTFPSYYTVDTDGKSTTMTQTVTWCPKGVGAPVATRLNLVNNDAVSIMVTGNPITVLPSTPIASFPNKNVTASDVGLYTLTSTDLDAVFVNRHSALVTQPTTSAVTYAIAPSSATGTPGESVAAGTVLNSGASGTQVYTVRATFAGDTNYNPATVDATITVTAPTVTLTVQANNAQAGNVTGGGSYPSATLRNITASANAGWRWDKWTIPNGLGTLGSDTTRNTTFFLNGSATAQANFIQLAYTTANVNPAASGTATVTASPIDINTETTISATPAFSYRFGSWSFTNGTVGNSNFADTTFTPNAPAASVTANFIKLNYVTTQTSLGGTVSTASAWGDTGVPFAISATANPGYRFGFWSIVNGTGAIASSTAASTTVTPATDLTIQANFIKIWTITTSVSPAGAGTVIGTGIHDHGSTVTLTLSPADGFTPISWSGTHANLLSNLYAQSVTVTITQDLNVEGNFTNITPAILNGGTPKTGWPNTYLANSKGLEPASPVGSGHPTQITLQNTGNSPLTVSAVTATTDFYPHPSNTGITIPAGGEVTVPNPYSGASVYFAPLGTMPPKVLSQLRQGQVYFLSDDPVAPLQQYNVEATALKPNWPPAVTWSAHSITGIAGTGDAWTSNLYLEDTLTVEAAASDFDADLVSLKVTLSVDGGEATPFGAEVTDPSTAGPLTVGSTFAIPASWSDNTNHSLVFTATAEDINGAITTVIQTLNFTVYNTMFTGNFKTRNEPAAAFRAFFTGTESATTYTIQRPR